MPCGVYQGAASCREFECPYYSSETEMAELLPQKQATFWRTLTLYIVGFAEFDVTICGKGGVAQLD